MDSKITIRFFRIEQIHQTVPAFEAALQHAFSASRTAKGRERDVGGAIIRLERLEKSSSCWNGEMVRKQTENIPPAADDDGLTPLTLSDGSGLGHAIAFRYSPALQVLAIQFDNRAVSVNRMISYLRSIDPSQEYTAFPLIREDAWDRYGRGRPSKLIVEIASPTDLPSVEGEVGSVISSTKRLAEISQAPVITIEMKMGRSKGSLAKEVVDGVINFFTKGDGKEQDIRKLEAQVRSDDGSEIVGFLQEGLKHSTTLDLPTDCTDVNYRARQNYVDECFSESFDYIRRVYGG